MKSIIFAALAAAGVFGSALVPVSTPSTVECCVQCKCCPNPSDCCEGTCDTCCADGCCEKCQDGCCINCGK